MAQDATPKSRLAGVLKVYLEPRDWWIGYYRGNRYHFVCPLPCIVIRVADTQERAALRAQRDA